MKIIKQGIVSRKTDGFFSYHAWPSACVDEKDTIYVVCSGFRMGHMCPFGKIVMFTSRDGGESFDLPTVLCDHYLDDRDPGLLYLGGGRMLLTRCSHPAETYERDFADWIRADSGEAGAGLLRHFPTIPPEERRGGCFRQILRDHGRTAEPEERIPVHCPHGPISLRDGTIIYLGKELFTGSEREGMFSVYTSSDRGETFRYLSDIPIPSGYEREQLHESHCAELKDGTILALFRAHLTENDNYFTMMKSVSKDGGRSWSELEETGVCGSPPHLCPLPDGRVVLTYGRRAEPFGIRARLISPTGEIDQDEITLASCEDDDIGYPATVRLKDGTLFTVYYARFGSDTTASLLSVKWTV